MLLWAKKPIDIPRPYGVRFPRGTPQHPSGIDELIKKSDRQIERAIRRAVEAWKRKRMKRDGPGPAGGGWSWDEYERRARRAMEDTIRRRRVPGTRGRRDVFPHPPPPMGPVPEPRELEEIAERVGQELERPPVMPPLPRTAESRGFGDIGHSFPRPPPEPLPVPVPDIAIPPVATPTPTPVPVPTSSPPPSSSPRPTGIPTPLGIPNMLPAALAAASVFVIRSRLTRPRSQTATPTSTPIPTPTPTPIPTPTAIPTPTPTTSSPPSSPPPNGTLTPVTPQSVCSPCRSPQQQRKDEKRRRNEKRKACRQFISIRVPAHKRKMCVQDFAKYLFRKLRRTATTAVRKRIISELEERGVPASRLRALTRKPRKPKAEIKVGGVEIDLKDLLGK